MAMDRDSGRSGHEDFAAATDAMARMGEKRYEPDEEAVEIYDRLYGLYRDLHDGFGREGERDQSHVMKDLLKLRNEVRGGE